MNNINFEPRQIIFSGAEYDFTINYTQEWFEIVATHRQSGKRSHINTLNYILSSFEIDPNSDRWENSDWSATAAQVQAWVQTAQELFSDSSFVQSLEKALDADRREGEWGNG